MEYNPPVALPRRWRVRPGEEIRLVKENLAFAVAFWKAAAAGSVPPEPLLRPAPAPRPFNQLPGGPRPDTELFAELTRSAANQMRAAFALSALQARYSLARAFPGEPIEQELPELRAALSSMLLIGQAVWRSILQPVWECPPPYRRLFQIRRLGFYLNAVGLDGRPLNWDDFGGLDCYLALLEYCSASADSAWETGDGRAILPPRLPQLDYSGILGAPSSAAGHADAYDAPPPSRIPAGYPGEDSRRRNIIPPDTPAAPDAPIAPDAAPPPSPAAPIPPPTAAAMSASAPPDPAANPIDRFIAECCETGPERRMLAGELYAAFGDWCRRAGHAPPSQRAFGMRLTRLGLTRKRRGHGKHWWEGIRVSPPIP